MKHTFDLSHVRPKKLYDLGMDFSGVAPHGERLSFSNYFMEIDGKPFYGISGEFHFSRCDERYWDDEILKMKMGGVNVVSTYIFWIHHEEEEGVFDFSGRRDLRRFIELCAKHKLYVIVRVGPFNHGEMRNGGLPDWLYGKPFDVRSTNEGFMDCVKKLYEQLHKQMDGLYYAQDGPIIATQIDNEYMHSAAPWEITTGISNEWMTSGSEGDEYMLRLLQTAKDAGVVTPFYTCTGWGGASTPDALMPLWGGYAFRPWIFYSHQGEHPATEEYIYHDNHNDAVPATYNFEPFYKPESRPYLCCEMGGGMTCCYYYRFQLPYESVDAMANIKLGSGCNMLGYYMYHGGTNPTGKRTPFLNEGQVPKLSYDYQAALGEYGQARASFHRLRLLHYFTQSAAETLCRAKTVLPENSQDIAPEDNITLRYCARIAEDGAGFLFINNYQDHAELRDKKDEAIELRLPKETLSIDEISLAAGENCILPFNQEIGGIPLKYALAQFITIADNTAFFMQPEGMKSRFAFGEGVKIEGDIASPKFTAKYQGKSCAFITLTREQSMDFYCVDGHVLLTKAMPLVQGGEIRFESDNETMTYSLFKGGAFVEKTLSQNPCAATVDSKEVGAGRYALTIGALPPAAKRVLLQLHYEGDIGQAFINGQMISDNFANGAVWEIDVKEHEAKLKDQPLTIYIVPLKKGSNVNVESVMAGRKEEVAENIARLKSISLRFIYEFSL